MLRWPTSLLPSPIAAAFDRCCVCVCACADDDADTLSLARSHSHPQNRYRPFRWPTKPPRATLWSAAREIRTVTIWSTAGQDHHLYQAKIKNKDKPCQIRSVKPHVKSFVYQLCWQVAMFFFCSVSLSSFPLRLVCFYRHRYEKKIAASIVLSLSLYISPAVEAKFDGVWLLSVFWLAYFSFSKCRFSVLRNWFLFVTRLENEAKISWFRCRYRSRQRADFRFTRPTRRII